MMTTEPPPLVKPQVGQRPMRRIVVVAIVMGLVVMAAGLAGLVAFALDAARDDRLADAHADGIVVVTGGSFRIADAVDLLMQRNGQRLLISGVNKSVGPREIARFVPAAAALFPCCIDLDYRALNTRGNAIEAAAWARRNGFRSLMLVTSRWHMPRMRLEIEREAPGLVLVFHPVADDRFRQDGWWLHGESLRTITFEYAKYLLAKLKIRWDKATDVKGALVEGHLP